jgi:hypothetical protein
MPIKNFFLSSSLAPTHSSYSHLALTTSTSLNYQSQDPHSVMTGTSLNCTSPSSPRSSGMTLNCQPPNYPPSPDSSDTTLNCNLTQTSHDMPSGHVGHLSHLRHLRHWTYCGMPSSPYVILRHLGQLRPERRTEWTLYQGGQIITMALMTIKG